MIPQHEQLKDESDNTDQFLADELLVHYSNDKEEENKYNYL